MNRLPSLLFAFCLSCEKPPATESRPAANAQNSIHQSAKDHLPDSAKALAGKTKSEVSVPTQRATTSGTKASPKGIDHGIFSELDEQVSIVCPSWLRDAPWLRFEVNPGSSGQARAWRALAGIALCTAEESSDASPGAADAGIYFSKEEELLKNNDADQDGIPDSIDILRGAKKVILNAATYRGGYVPIAFPGGDVPRDQGVCTDVIVRALRNAGFDLQELVAHDISQRASAYPMVKKADSNIDHRRVRTLLPYFAAHHLSLAPQAADQRDPFFPGDILFMNTLGDAAPEHMGIVSDRLGKSGLPLVVNNWTDGTKTTEMDLLPHVPVTHRFRVGKPILVPQAEQGLDGLLKRSRLTIPASARQAVSVVSTLWSSSAGLLKRWERNSATDSWVAQDQATPVVLGSAGLGQGRGLASALLAPRKKLEGDKRSPAGVFSLGTAFGRTPLAPYAGAYSYRMAGEGDFWVDDENASEYNTWVKLPLGSKAPWSAERLTMYRLGLVVNHNVSPIEKGSGSAIFIHPWASDSTPTVGCTALAIGQLMSLLGWLNEEHAPVFVQTAGHIF